MADNRAKDLEEQKENNQSPTKLSMKQDNKQIYEVYKIYDPLEDFRFGMWINPNNKGTFRHKPIEFVNREDGRDIGIQCEVPSKMMSIQLIMRALWTSFDYKSDPNLYNKDIIMGGILNVECLEYPPSMKKGPGWTLKPNFEVFEAVKRIRYPAVDQNNQVNYSTVLPVKVSYNLPEYLLIYQPYDQIRVALYDDMTKIWSTELIQDIKFDAEKKNLIFSTFKIAPFAYIQERCSDYPYVSWKLRCVKPDVAILDIECKRDTFKFEIGPGYAMLINRTEPELKHITGKKMLVGGLLNSLQKSGIHLIPISEDSVTANISSKEGKVEDLCISDLVFAVRSFFIKSSRFSYMLKNTQVLLRIRENLEYDEFFAEDQEKDWKSIIWHNNKVEAVKSKDSYSTCSEAKLDDTLAHANLHVLLKTHDLTDAVALDRMQETQNIIFQDTLSVFLKLTHLTTFTAGKQAKL